MSNIIPLITVLSAILVIVLSQIKILKLSISEEIIIAILALLAIDALSERLSILGKIEKELSRISSGNPLKARNDLPTIEEQAEKATEICIIAVSAISLIHRHLHFYKNRMNEGCNIKVVLLNPDCYAIKAYNSQYGRITAKNDILATLDAIKELVKFDAKNGSCEVRLLDIFLPFSIFAVDTNKSSGSMVVEFHNYKKAFGENLHIFLKANNSPVWFNFYREQFEDAWSDAKDWIP